MPRLTSAGPSEQNPNLPDDPVLLMNYTTHSSSLVKRLHKPGAKPWLQDWVSTA
ncbi:MAG: hypothetical protein OXG81_06390 [Acidobacteria bacterium]|nr:hypothetical protein [Acidobacteriota bacterium]